MIGDMLTTLLVILVGCILVVLVLAGSFLATVRWLCGDRRKKQRRKK